MGGVNCCSEIVEQKKTVKIRTTAETVQKTEYSDILQDVISTQSPTKNKDQIIEAPLSPVKQMSFTGYLLQKQVDLSEIKPKESGQDDECNEQKIFLSYLQRLSKQIEKYRKQHNLNLQKVLADRNQQVSPQEKRFIEHAADCPVCNELYENLKNVEIEQPLKASNFDFKRKSMRDSLLEFIQEQKMIETEQATYMHLHSHQQAKKAMKKYPNSNIYQCKRLRFRKTSNFQPEIPQINESQQATICR